MGFGRYMDSCGACMKYTLFFINLLTFLGGLAIAGLGIYMIVDKTFTIKLLGASLYTGAIYVLIATGILVALISCFGCFGAAQEVRCMLVTYFIIIFLIFVTMLVGGILGYVFRDKVETSLRITLESELHSYRSNEDSKKKWDDMQYGFGCCGIDSYHDWKGVLPDSCCSTSHPGIPYPCREHDNNRFDRGCLTYFTDLVSKNAAIIGGVGIALACVMLLEMIFACALANMIE